jgi:hypothetical protein
MTKILEAEGGAEAAARLASWVTISEGMQPGRTTKILEAERWLKGTNLHEVALLPQRDEDNTGAPHRGLGRRKGATHEESAKAWLPPRRSIPF